MASFVGKESGMEWGITGIGIECKDKGESVRVRGRGGGRVQWVMMLERDSGMVWKSWLGVERLLKMIRGEVYGFGV